VENPREIVDPGDEVKVKILEIDNERRRLSLSLKRVEGQVLPLRERTEVPPVDGDEPAAEGEQSDVADVGLSEEVFADEGTAPAEAEPELEAAAQADEATEGAASEAPAGAEDEAAGADEATESDQPT
jgi:small subunit ribosomal protein S1